MHDTALTIGSLFLDNYARPPCTVVELGAMNVNGTLRNMAPEAAVYIGLDMEAGHGVDVVVKPGAPLPLASETADLVISSSMFEHDSFFWETFLEMVRIAKPNGAIYINAPSNGQYHRYPADNWRFYPDCGKALESWARKNNFVVTLIEFVHRGAQERYLERFRCHLRQERCGSHSGRNVPVASGALHERLAIRKERNRLSARRVARHGPDRKIAPGHNLIAMVHLTGECL